MPTASAIRWLLFAAAAATLVCSQGAEPAPSALSPADLEARLSAAAPPLVLDVRTPAEFARGAIPGARSLPLGELETRLLELEPFAESEIVVTCEAGPRAERALALLRDAGFRRASLLEGSMRRWRAEGRPLARAAP